MKNIQSYLSGGDLRSTSHVDELLPFIKTQRDFDELFQFLLSEDRLLAMRAIDAVEKITLREPDFLQKHKAIPSTGRRFQKPGWTGPVNISPGIFIAGN